MKFYDMSSRKSVNIPEKEVKYVTKGKTRMATAKGPKGNSVWRIVGKEK